MILKNLLQKLTLVVILAGLLGGVYWATLAPGLAWANRGADGGDLVTAAATGGVAHPSGYPTYLFLASLFQSIPTGNLAFRTNLMSAFFGVLAALIISDLARRSYSSKRFPSLWIGIVTGLAFGLSPLFWSQAIITEVYTLNIFFIVLLLRLAPLNERPPEKWKPWLDIFGGVIFGLALGNQLTVIFIFPLWILVGSLDHDKVSEFKWNSFFKTQNPFLRLWQLLDWHSLLRQILFVLVGLTIYFSIPVRAQSGSPVVWGNPVDLKGLWWLISGQLYQDRVFSLELQYLVPRIRNWAGWLQNQFGLAGLIIGFIGLFYGKPNSKRFYWITGWIMLVYSVFAIGYASSDSYTQLIPAYVAFALWFGLGVATIIAQINKRLTNRWFSWGILGLILVLIGLNAWQNYPEVNASRDTLAETFVQTVFSAAPPQAILFTKEDEDSFALWYAHFVNNERTDIRIIVEPLLSYDWYRANLRRTYPTLKFPLPDAALTMSNFQVVNSHPVCEITLKPSLEACPSCIANAAKMIHCEP
jgi:hypothetical protein